MDSPDLVVGFLMRNRPEYTRRTLESFVRQFEKVRWEGWYVDDASIDQEGMRALAEGYGMKPLIRNLKTKGCCRSSLDMAGRLSEKYSPETLFLYLQNDFEFLRPVPFEAILALLEDRPDVGWVRLAGKWNSGVDKPRIKEDWIPEIPPAQWLDCEYQGEFFELGKSYFCFNPPSILPLGTFYFIMQGAKNEREAALNAKELCKWTARVAENVAVHIGDEKTDAFRA